MYLDSLIAVNEIPVMVGGFVSSGHVPPYKIMVSN